MINPDEVFEKLGWGRAQEGGNSLPTRNITRDPDSNYIIHSYADDEIRRKYAAGYSN